MVRCQMLLLQIQCFELKKKKLFDRGCHKLSENQTLKIWSSSSIVFLDVNRTQLKSPHAGQAWVQDNTAFYFKINTLQISPFHSFYSGLYSHLYNSPFRMAGNF